MAEGVQLDASSPPPLLGAHPSVPRPFLPEDQADFARAKEAANRKELTPPSRRLPVAEAPSLLDEREAATSDGAATTAVATTTSATLISHDEQAATFGRSVVPPDTQTAISPTRIVEFVNTSGVILDRATMTRVGGLFDLYQFPFSVPAGYQLADPKLFYDAMNSRFVGSAFAFIPAGQPGAYNSIVYVVISNTSDPNGVWTRYTLPLPQNGTQYDQPKVGVSQDKAVISWNDYDTSNTLLGSQTWVMAYSQMLAAQSSVQMWSFGRDGAKFSVTPAHQLTGISRSWATYNASHTRGRAGIVRIDGNPITGPVTLNWDEYDWAPTSVPSDAQQLATSALINTGDDRSQSAVYRAGTVWMGTNDECVIGTNPPRACVRLTRWNVTTSPPTLVQALLVAGSGGYLYYPGVTMDGDGNTYSVYSRSSSTSYAFVQATNVLAGTPNGQVSGSTNIKLGEAPYTDSRNRWGDYSSAGPDPAADANRVWVAGQYAGPGSGNNWGTVVAQLSP